MRKVIWLSILHSVVPVGLSRNEQDRLFRRCNTYLYLAVYDGDRHAFLGRKKEFGDKSIVMKIGISNSPKRRCEEVNAGIPPASQG